MTMFTGKDRARALGVWSGLAGLGSALGVILGGVLTTEASWRWIFTINVPIGAALLIAIPLIVPAVPAVPAGAARPGAPGLDIPGGVLVTTGTGAAIYGLINAGTSGWAAPSTLVAFALAVVAWAAFAQVERRTASPLLAVGLLLRRPVAAGGVLMLIGTGLLVGTFFLGSFSLQHADGYSALRVGLSFIPVAVATVAGALTASRVLARVPARPVAVAGLALAAARAVPRPGALRCCSTTRAPQTRSGSGPFTRAGRCRRPGRASSAAWRSSPGCGRLAGKSAGYMSSAGPCPLTSGTS
jgi:MFS family permease